LRLGDSITLCKQEANNQEQFARENFFVTRQPPKGGKDDYEGSQVFFPEALSRRRRRGEGRGGERGWREERSAIKVDVGVDVKKSKIMVESRRGHRFGEEDFSESVRV